MSALRAERLQKQLTFFREIERLKMVYRRAWLSDQSRTENDAEHSWHLAILPLLFEDIIAEKGLDLLRILTMVLIHDIVEADAGDTYAFDTVGAQDKWERESRAADRLYGLLPDDQRDEFRALWEEFDREETPDARFAACLDKFHPFFQNWMAEGKGWRINKIDSTRVRARLLNLQTEFPELYEVVDQIIAESLRRGYILEE